MEEKTDTRADTQPGKMNGWLALSPLALFLAIFLTSSLIAGDFYSVNILAGGSLLGLNNIRDNLVFTNGNN